MAINDLRELTGLEKAATLLIAMGPAGAAEVFKRLNESEIELLSAQIVKMRRVDRSMIESVILELDRTTSDPGQGVGGRSFVSEVLEASVGAEKATELLERASSPAPAKPFESLWEQDAGRLAKVLNQEHPQVIAMALTNLPPQKAAAVMSGLDEAVQAEAASRICTMRRTDPEVLSAVEEALEMKLTTAPTQSAAAGGPKALVEILNNAERSTERTVLESLSLRDPEVGDRVRRMMFVFEDLPKLEDRTVQVVLREVDQEDLRLALKEADEEVRSLVFRNMSERAAEMLKEDLELVGNVKPKDAEAAQQKIINVVRRLLTTGEAVLKPEGEDQSAEADVEEIAAARMSDEEETAVVPDDQTQKAA